MRISAFPDKLPAQITVDLETLSSLDAQITVADLDLGEGVSTHVASTELVAVVSRPSEEPEATTAEPDLASIEVEKKGKKEDEEAAA